MVHTLRKFESHKSYVEKKSILNFQLKTLLLHTFKINKFRKEPKKNKIRINKFSIMSDFYVSSKMSKRDFYS